MQSLRTYLNSLEPSRQHAFSASCGTTLGYLRKACSINQRLGADLCIAIERESGGRVRCEDLRPDVDWAYMRATDCPVAKVGAGETAQEGHDANVLAAMVPAKNLDLIRLTNEAA